ncbi:TPA: copper-translocating P-type ATPase CopA [Vibrio cholerae]|uniref:copper-translocating P-type ATPase CopA n=1 Tax=Vibrio cholerae TaxID=666 RepID=UPI0012EB230F|nr:copper-translocating P-type ATPase CopA [Vibrio cholerae]HDV5390019.1 copper-translocating P-type ATPase CopA [Vibrio cholerae]HDV5395627.1 copper-translocating P-type ATPase CopA [Vibrio cholerae]HDV5411346.1 copper-translocating P-type ATPase CopA [Vibrio cholerae]HDV5417602.1 copper-translocating P-type ATPase CopA [Vibrio cholerae]HDV5424647.1 copper-translocating P-type ATPase CopA [Vibrio cholerae]
MNHFALALRGLNCMGCARKLERQLKQDLTVEIETLTPTSIELHTHATLNEVLTSIESLGYQGGTEQTYQLQGLNCGRCVNKLTTHLSAQAEIAKLQASKERLSLVTTLTAEQVKALVAEVGYQAIEAEQESTFAPAASIDEKETDTPDAENSSNTEPTEASSQTLSLLIKGMTCASCVASVEKALLSVEGVQSAQVNLAEQSALVRGIFANPQPLLNAIQSSGYQAEILDDPAQQQAKQQAQLDALQKEHKQSALLGIALGAPLMLWGVFGGNMMIRNSSDQMVWGGIGIICFALLLTAGRHFFMNAWQALTHGRATMDTLVALGTGAAWFYSMLVVAWPQTFPNTARHVYFEATAMIIGLISLGHYIETKAKSRTNRSLQALLNLQPQQATLVTEQGDQSIAVADIQLGMSLRIKPGEQVPVDGVVSTGHSYLDESMLTGEPIPVLKEAGAKVAAGTLNQDGSLVITATGIGAQTMLARIIQMVRQAQSSKPAMARLADQISSVFVPVVVVIAILSAALWYLYGPDPKASYMLVVATTVLIIACPCALGLATPLSITVGIGKAAEMGILIRDANVLQTASQIDTVVFDKTGTLTLGKPSIQSLHVVQGDENQLLALAYALEQQSEHPLAKAICDYAKQRNIRPVEVNQFTNQRGRGLLADYQNQTVLVGSLAFMQEQGIDLSMAESTLEKFAAQAWTPVAVAYHGMLQGVLAIADPIKPTSAQAVRKLNELGIHTVMLTGDHASVANAIAKELGISQVIAQVLPDQKAQHIQALQQQGRKVAMIGDGINDAPALALADIGIAMGSGSDVAIESAQMTLLNSSPTSVVSAIELSKATLRNMKQNLFGAFIYNTLGIPIAAGVLYPAFGFLLSPVVAGAAMALSSITVVSNANRLRWSKISFDQHSQ